MSSNENGYNRKGFNSAQQGATESAQFLIAIAVGIFGILTMLLVINHHVMISSTNRNEREELGFRNAFSNKGSWTFAEGIVLSIAYWALVLFGFQSYVARRLFEGLMGYYMKNTDPEWHKSDIIKIAQENRLAKWMVKRIWASNYEKEDRFKHMIPALALYFAITFSLWFFVAIL